MFYVVNLVMLIVLLLLDTKDNLTLALDINFTGIIGD